MTIKNVEDFFRETGELTIKIPALPQPTLAELQAKFNWIKSIERDTSPTEALTLKLATVLGPKEESIIGGMEYELRLKPKHDILLGYQQAQWFVEHQNEFPELKQLFGKIYIDFPGLVVVSSLDHRSFPYLGHGDERWKQNWDWIDDDLHRRWRIAVSSKPD